MDLNYTWAVTSLTTATVSDVPEVVLNVKWTLTGADTDGDSGTFHGATPLTTKNIDPESFVPFDQLTEELVLSWVKPVVENDPAYKSHIDAQINKQIQAKKQSIKTDSPLPWAEPENTTPPDLSPAV